MKQCNSCKELKDESCFYIRKTYHNYLDSVCKTCKCLQRQKHHKINKDRENAYQKIRKRSYIGRYNTLRDRVKKSNIELCLTENQYIVLIDSPCYYCNNKLGLPPETGIGLDRLDNSKGYIEGNVVSCCEFCNCIKNYLLSSTEMKLIADLLIKERNNFIPINASYVRMNITKLREI